MSFIDVAIPISTVSTGIYDHETTAVLPVIHSPSQYGVHQDAQRAQFEAEFAALIEDWRTDTLNLSSITEMVTHPSYLRIIANGERALPYLFRELERQPDHWFVALEAITGANPVPRSEWGNFQSMVEHWLDWATEEGYG